MKKLFWIGILGLFAFEILNVYFIMPMPGSQEMNSIDIAYFLFKWRWIFRGLFVLLIVIGLVRSRWKRKWLLAIPLLLVAAVTYMANFKMAADHMFYQPKKKLMVPASENKVDPVRLVIGVVNNTEARAYPIQFLGYHHQVLDTVGGKPMIITYCTVCRSGRAFEPLINNKQEKFRLVGMDHFNAMFEDASTKSWWRQVNGEAITGKRKGMRLPEVLSTQTSLEKWLQLYPSSLVMQADPAFLDKYDSTTNFETGLSKSKLTGTDTVSWENKSWVVGVRSNNATKAYDWNRLKKERIIHDQVGNSFILVVLADDNKSFFAYERPRPEVLFTLNNDTLIHNDRHFSLTGKGIDTAASLARLHAYQEFWHSWKTFNPGTKR